MRPSALVLVALLAAPAAAQVQNITIVNPGFEAQALANPGDFISGTVTGWSVTTEAGVYRPTAFALPGLAPEGLNVAYIGGAFGGGPITQTLSSTLAAGSYSLVVQVGDRLDTTFAGYTVELWAGNTLLARDNNTLTPADGTFLTSTVQYDASTADPLLGQPLSIHLTAPFSANSVQTVFDAVSLQFTPVPEPAGLLLVAVLGGYGLRRWRAGKCVAAG